MNKNLFRGLLLLCLVSAGQLLLKPAHAANPCPAVGNDTLGCALVIDITSESGGAATAFSVSAGAAYAQGPYDGIEDTLVGVINTSGGSVSSLFLNGGTTDIFGFDGDGPCDGLYITSPSPIPGCSNTTTDPGDYAPAGVTFSGINSALTSGTVKFASGLSSGGTGTWFGLEETLTPTSIVNGTAPEIDALSAASALTLLIGGLLVLRGRRSGSGAVTA